MTESGAFNRGYLSELLIGQGAYDRGQRGEVPTGNRLDSSNIVMYVAHQAKKMLQVVAA